MIFSVATTIAWALVVLVAKIARGRRAIFVGVLLGIYSLIANAFASRVGVLLPIYAYLHATVYVTFAMLARPKMWPLAYRIFVSWPGSWFLGSTMLAFPWAIVAAFGLRPLGFWVPYAIGFLGLLDSFRSRQETVHIVVGRDSQKMSDGNRAVRSKPPREGTHGRPLRIVQITDPHLGAFMSVARLRRFCERAVAANPDVVLLTGDFLTVDSQEDRALLGQALAPLRPLEGRTFACLGNHDHEAPEHVRDGLASAGVTLLVDEMTRLETAAGPCEILGFDFRWRERSAHLEAVSARYPRTDAVRIGLLHDPGAFRHLPPGTADLVLSGHTHGGQVGLLWLGLPHTFVSMVSSIPDHGLWARGKDLLYVHRGTGHYGFPLRLGVPPEESILEVHRAMA